MPNWCLTDYMIEGSEESLKKINDALLNHDVAEDSSENWEGNVLIALGYTEEEWGKYVQKYTFNETCQGSVPEAIYCALSSNDYEQAIRKAVSLGGDADTQAAIAGGISAAFCPVPLSIIEECLKLLPEELRDVIFYFNSSLEKRIVKQQGIFIV